MPLAQDGEQISWLRAHPIRLTGSTVIDRAATGRRRWRGAPLHPEPETRGAIAVSLAPEPARPRLVHLLSRRRADRLRSVRRGLSDDAKMDPGRDRLRAVDRRHHRPDRADARRRHRRCRPLRTAGREPCGRDHRRLRARICRYGRSFRSWSRPRRCTRPRAACSVRRLPRSASVWSDRLRSASGSGATPALPRSATASAAALMGTVRLSAVEPLGVSRHLPAGDPDLAGAGAHPRARNRCRAGAWRGRARGRPMPAQPAF